MSKGFNLTATLNLKGPVGVDAVVKTLKRELSGVEARIDIKLGKTAGDIERITKSFAKFNSTLETTTVTATNAARAIASLSQSINSADFGRAANQINSTTKSVGTLTKSFNSTAHSIDQATFSANKFGHDSALALKRFAAFSIPTTAFFAIIGAFASGTKSALEFDRQMLKIGQTLERPTGTLKELESVLTSLSTNLGVSSKELASVALTLAQAGLNAKETEAALSALAKTALSPSFDNMTNTTEGLIAAIEQFNLKADEYESKLSVINTVSAKYAVESSDIVTAIRKSGGAFKAAGGTMEELVALFSSIRSTTRESADTIASGLNTIAGRLQRPETVEALSKMNIQLRDMEGNFVGVFEAFQRLGKGLSNIDPRSETFAAIVEQVGGLRQLAKVVPGITQYAKAQRILNDAKNAGNSLDLNTQQAQQNLLVKLDKLKESFLELFRIIASSKTFQILAGALVAGAGALLEFAKAGKDVIPIIAALAAVKVGQGLKGLPQFLKGFHDFFANTGQATGGPDPLAAVLERRAQAEQAAAKVRDKARRVEENARKSAAAAEAKDQKAKLAALKEEERQRDRLAKKQKAQAAEATKTGSTGGGTAKGLSVTGLDKNTTALAKLTFSVDKLANIINRWNPGGGGGGTAGGGGGGGRGSRGPRGGGTTASPFDAKKLAEAVLPTKGSGIDPMFGAIFGAQESRPPTDFFVGSRGGTGRSLQEAKRAENFERLQQRNEERRASQAAAYQSRIAARERSNLALQEANQRRRQASMRSANVGSAAFQDRQRQEAASINTSTPLIASAQGLVSANALRRQDGLGAQAITDLHRPFGAGAATARNSASAFGAFQQGLNPSQLRSRVVNGFGPQQTTTTNRGITDILNIDKLDETRRVRVPNRNNMSIKDRNQQARDELAGARSVDDRGFYRKGFVADPNVDYDNVDPTKVYRKNLARRLRRLRNQQGSTDRFNVTNQFVEGQQGFTSGLPSRTTVNDIGASSAFITGASPHIDARNKDFSKVPSTVKGRSLLSRLPSAKTAGLGLGAIAAAAAPVVLGAALPDTTKIAAKDFESGASGRARDAARNEGVKSGVNTALSTGITTTMLTGNPIIGALAGATTGLIAFTEGMDSAAKEINTNRLSHAVNALADNIELITNGKINPASFKNRLSDIGEATRNSINDNKSKPSILLSAFGLSAFGAKSRDNAARSNIESALAEASAVQIRTLDAIEQRARKEGGSLSDNKLAGQLVNNREQQLIAASRDPSGKTFLARGDEDTAALVGKQLLQAEVAARDKAAKEQQRVTAGLQELQNQMDATSAGMANLDANLKVLNEILGSVSLSLDNQSKAIGSKANLAIGGQGQGFSISTLDTSSNTNNLEKFFGSKTGEFGKDTAGFIRRTQDSINSADAVEARLTGIDPTSITDSTTLSDLLFKIKDDVKGFDPKTATNIIGGGKDLRGTELRDFIIDKKQNRGGISSAIKTEEEKKLEPFRKGVELSTKAMQDYAANLQVLNKITEDNLQIRNRIAQKGVDIANASAARQSAITGRDANRFISDDQFLGGFNQRIGGLLGQAGINAAPGSVTPEQIKAKIASDTAGLAGVQAKLNTPGGRTAENVAAADAFTNSIRASQKALEELATATEPLANVERKLAGIVADRTSREQLNKNFGSSGIKERFETVANIKFLEAAAKRGKFINVAEQQRALAGASALGSAKLSTGEAPDEAVKRIFAGTEQGLLKITDQSASKDEIGLREKQEELLKKQQDFLTAMLAVNQQVATTLKGELTGFATSADKLTDALNKFTPNLTLTGTTTVDVRIVGADVLATIEPSITNLVTRQVNDAVNKAIVDRFPDAGVPTGPSPAPPISPPLRRAK